ncbi:MAG: fructose-specific PTS transporter subunit EIIC, partial [Fusobacteriaceae bacterium]|nr:fructose-specific PTS transporter subunit EIIC [Fusobacteriaceae bacterium]
MKITDLLTETRVKLNVETSSKDDVIEQAVNMMTATGVINDAEVYKKAVFAREAQGTTSMGEGVAIPHAKTDTVKFPALVAMVLPKGVDYNSLDGEPTNLLFLIAAPNTKDNVHLDVLSRLSTLLIDDDFRSSLIAAESVSEFLNIIDKTEKKKFPTETVKNTSSVENYRLLAVTACPTGIAHTYMAAESLEKAANTHFISIKVETNGASGIKNKLTQKEIKNCDCIIIAADKEVEIARFNGKSVIFAKAADGIHKANELIEKAINGKTPIYRNTDVHDDADGHDTIGRTIYKQLMNGVSHMLPFVIGGGILIALSFLFDSANAGTSSFGSGNSLSLFFNKIGGLAFGMMLPILAGFIAMAIGDRPALMVGIVGGIIAKTGFSITLPEDQWTSSGFFGALIAGFLAGYLMIGIRKLLSKLPAALEGIKPVLLFPLLGILSISLIMVFIVNKPMGAFNVGLSSVLSSMDNSKIILGAILGAMMSIDFGGPINKTAYVFGTASIAFGQFDIMAAVMIGGMVPPIVIALSTLFFKNRFTVQEQKTTLTNFIMGFSFITEGAIPFAASDPLRVIPSCAIGSAIAGMLSMI